MSGPNNPPTSDFTWNEDLIGKRILPITGALLLLGALGYWTPVAYRALTQGEAFIAELVASIALILGGRFFAKKTAFFGEVISGLGAGALLVTIMAGYQFHHVYSGTVMVGLSMAASVGTCVAGMRLKSRTFEAIGAIGGMISAWMPISQHDVYVSAILQFLIVTATLGVFVHGQWKEGILGTWILASITNYAFSFASQAIWQWQALAYLVLALECALAYCFCVDSEPSGLDKFIPGAFVSVAIAGMFEIMPRSDFYSPAVMVYGGFLCLVGLLFGRESGKRDSFLYPGLIGLFLVGPATFETPRPEMPAIALAAAYTLGAGLFKDVRFSLLAMSQTVIATLFYIGVGQSAHAALTIPAWMTLMATVYALSLVVYKRTGIGEAAFILAALSEAGLSFLPPTQLFHSIWHGEFLVSGLISVWGLVMLLTGVKLTSISARVGGYLLLGVALCKVLAVDLSGLDGTFKSAILTFLGTTMLVGGYIVIRNLKSEPIVR